MHHRKGKANKGSDEISNLLVLHKTCHKSVTFCKDSTLLARYVSEGIIILDKRVPIKPKR